MVGCPDGDDKPGPADPGPTTTGETTGGETTGGETTGGETTGGFIGCQSDADCEGTLGDLGACVTPVCDVVQKNCKPQPQPNGTACDDGDPCTEAGQCNGGQCGGVKVACNDDNPCTNDACDPITGKCAFIPNGALCDDGLLCTVNDQCSDGECKGAGNPDCQCQNDDDCKQFDDADLCNGVLTCAGNECVPKAGTVVECPDGGGPCRDNQCDPANGECDFVPKPEGSQCDDGDACTTADECGAGVCKGAPKKCDDENPCTDDTCDGASGCVFANNEVECDDTNLCTIDDTCADGTCQGLKNPDCEDCTENADCATFEDGDKCNGTLKCDAGACVVDDATVVSCQAEVLAAGPCQTVKCGPTTGKCETQNALDGESCSDADACTESDHCVAGACVGAKLECNDNVLCTDDSCDKASGCVFAPNTGTTCDDGNVCTSDDACKEGVCVGGGDCTCTENADCAPFDDGNLCNGTLACVEGECVPAEGSEVVCNDTGVNPCVAVQCVPDTGNCLSSPVNDGDECNDKDACSANDVCAEGVCGGTKLNCDDGKLCTDDACDAALGCTHTFNDAACEDGNSCTENDKCKQGTCSGTPTVACGCESDADCAAFDDGNKCNGTLVCSDSKCLVDPSTVVSCALATDATGCQIDQCIPETGECGLAAVPDGKSCDDKDACTLNDSCQGGACTSDTDLECDDGNECTVDVCLTGTGCQIVPDAGGACDDGNPCTSGDVCGGFLGLFCQPGTTNDCADQCQPQVTAFCNGFHTSNTGGDGSTNNLVDYSCDDWSYPGPEFAYRFVAPFDGTLHAILENETSITDVLVLEASEAGCEPSNCLDFGFSTVDTPMEAGKTYYIVVDGFTEAAGDYTLTTTCTPANEIFCADGVDGDDDGAIDCEDEDCAEAPACAVTSCAPAWELTCGSSDTWANYLPGSTNAYETYDGCGNPWNYPAPEYTYFFDATADGPVTLTLSGETAETDVIVLTAGDENACVNDTCVAYGLGGVTFDATAGTRYHVVVDGWNGAEGVFKISMECADVEPPVADTCNPKKEIEMACDMSVTLTNDDAELSQSVLDTYSCSDDNYSGPEVAGSFTPAFTGTIVVGLTGETAETDIFVMSDADGMCKPENCIISDFDTVLVDVTAGTTYWIVVDGFNGESGEFTMEMLCEETPVDPPTGEDCGNGTDDDDDGAVDCEDSDCFGASESCQPACVPSMGAATLTCGGDAVSGSNDAEGSNSVVEFYSCNEDNYPAPEFIYTWVADVAGPVTIELNDNLEETDVLVIEDKGLGCNPASCLTFGFTGAAFDAVMGTTYYIVVDGYDGAVASYDLVFSCGG